MSHISSSIYFLLLLIQSLKTSKVMGDHSNIDEHVVVPLLSMSKTWTDTCKDPNTKAQVTTFFDHLFSNRLPANKDELKEILLASYMRAYDEIKRDIMHERNGPMNEVKAHLLHVGLDLKWFECCCKEIATQIKLMQDAVPDLPIIEMKKKYDKLETEMQELKRTIHEIRADLKDLVKCLLGNQQEGVQSNKIKIISTNEDKINMVMPSNVENAAPDDKQGGEVPNTSDSNKKPDAFQIMRAQSKVSNLKPVFHLSYADHTVAQFLAIFMKGHGKITSFTMDPFCCPIDCQEKQQGKVKVSLCHLICLIYVC
jgi:hypothetical protein